MIVVVPLKGTGFAVATRAVAIGAATTVLLVVPAAEVVPAALVAVQLRPTEPVAPAWKVTLAPLVADVKVPLVMVQAKVMPAWGRVVAV